MGHYDDIIEAEHEQKRQEEERRRTARCEEIRANIIRNVTAMGNDEIEFLGKLFHYLAELREIDSDDMKFILDIIDDLPAYRGFFKVLRNK